MNTPASDINIDNEISTVQNEINTLHSSVRLSSIRDEMENMTTQTSTLYQRVKALRVRSYAFEIKLEDQGTSFNNRWLSMRSPIEIQLNQQSSRLENEMGPIEMQLGRVNLLRSNPATVKPALTQLKTSVENMKSKASAAENSIKGMYDKFHQELRDFIAHIEKVEWMLTQLDEASFRLMNSEAGIMAVKATLVEGKEDKDDPQGILFLTDQRLVFEQKQEVATKKVLFITTAKEKVQKLLFEAPVSSIEKIDALKQGVFKNEDHLMLSFASGKPQVHFHIFSQDGTVWQGLINRAKSKDFDRDRAIKLSQQEVEKVRQAPSICPQCGGTITKPVLRGQDNITCEYCGYVIRL
jgi:hypothetical protein